MTEPQQYSAATGHAGSDQSRPRQSPTLVLGHILWRRWCLVAFGALLSALLVGMILHLLPPVYRTTLVYERPLTASEYRVLLSRFYSSENLGKIIARLRTSGLADYAALLERAETRDALEDLIRFDAFPVLPARLQTIDQETAELMSNFQAQLLYVEMTGPLKGELSTISDIVAADIENVLPLYDIRDDLRESVRTIRTRIGQILDHRSAREVELQQEQARLALTNRLLEEIDRHLPTDYTVQQYLDFLDQQLAACKEEEARNQLQSYLRRALDLAYVGNRAAEKPLVLAVSKHVVTGGVLAFIVSLMVMTFVAVTLEQRSEQLGPAPRRSSTPGQLS